MGMDKRPRIERVEEQTKPCPQGFTLKKVLHLECGHTATPNPIYSYRVGDPYKCFACNHPEEKPGQTAVRRVNAALKAAGREERLTYNSSKDYYFFYGGRTAWWGQSGVYVSRNSGEAMSTDEWLAQFAILGEID